MICRRHSVEEMKEKILSQGKGPVVEGNLSGLSGEKRATVVEAQRWGRRWFWRGRWGPELAGPCRPCWDLTLSEEQQGATEMPSVSAWWGPAKVRPAHLRDLWLRCGGSWKKASWTQRYYFSFFPCNDYSSFSWLLNVSPSFMVWSLYPNHNDLLDRSP